MIVPANNVIIHADRLTKTYPDGCVHALVDVTLDLHKGQAVAIMGKSGSGKSTLLNLLGALDVPTSGEISFEGQPFSRWPSLDRLRAAKIGFVFQSFHLLPTLTACENVQIPMFSIESSPRRRLKRAVELLDWVAMGHRSKHLPSRLSAGERQRVSIARALANDPTLLLADEPTGNLDSHNGDEVMNLFDRLHRERGMTLVIVTHSSEVADRAERVIYMRDGRLVSDETKQKII